MPNVWGKERTEAKASNEKTYVPRKPCRRGHSLRYTGSGACFQCNKDYHKNTTPEKRAQLAAKARKHREKNRERLREQWRQSGWKRNGTPLPLTPRPGLCECCNKPPGKKGLSVDHCHVTGKFRGWLCGKCNVGIGALGDDLAGLRQAVSYLQRVKAA